MPSLRDSAPIRRTYSDLVDAARSDADLPDEEWEKLWADATPYQRRVARLIANPELAPHGVEGTYTNWGCRCDPCSDAATAARQGRRVNSDFAEADHTQGAEATPLEKALLARRMGFSLTPKAEALIAAHEAGNDAADVI